MRVEKVPTLESELVRGFAIISVSSEFSKELPLASNAFNMN